jgi:hypothetical protein
VLQLLLLLLLLLVVMVLLLLALLALLALLLQLNKRLSRVARRCRLERAAGFPAGTFTLILGSLLVSFSGMPLLLAADLAAVSTQCDRLMEVLHQKRLQAEAETVGDDDDDGGGGGRRAGESGAEGATWRLELFLLVDALEHANGRQGLGFMVCGVVVDLKMLGRVGSTMAGLLMTVLPLILGLQTNETTDSTAAASTGPAPPPNATAREPAGSGGGFLGCGSEAAATVGLSVLEQLAVAAFRAPADSNLSCTVSSGSVICSEGGSGG